MGLNDLAVVIQNQKLNSCPNSVTILDFLKNYFTALNSPEFACIKW